MATTICNLRNVSESGEPGRRRAYHVPPEIGFFVLLETFEILENAGTGVLDVLFGNLQCLLQLDIPLVLETSETSPPSAYLNKTFFRLTDLVPTCSFRVHISEPVNSVTDATEDFVRHKSSTGGLTMSRR